MPKYKSLTSDELKALEKEFIEFLVVNGITADDWVKVKKESKENAEKIIDLFSDVVWEGVLRKTKFIEYRASQEIKSFQCLDDKIILMALKIDEPEIDLRTPEGREKLAETTPETECYTSSKPYKKDREMEIFHMIQNGCIRTDGKLFKAIALMLAEEQEKN